MSSLPNQPAPKISVVVAEKPSVARDIARVLGAHKQRQGFLEGNGYRVTWAIGHLVTLAQPHEIQAAWAKWRLVDLPMIPGQWPLVVYEKLKSQFEIVKQLLLDDQVDNIIAATDAGREGELIFRYIFEMSGCQKPTRRLWISSLTDEAIREGFARLKPLQQFDRLADAARGRARADWLVGLNLSRLYSLLNNDNLSVGRVQTPTLAMLVEREKAIRDFKPEQYVEVMAHLDLGEAEPAKAVLVEADPTKLEAAELDPKAKGKKFFSLGKRFVPQSDELQQTLAELSGVKTLIVERQEGKETKIPPPQFYDLTELQRHANRAFGYSAQKTLDIAQALYEKHKVITYPRTDSRHLSEDMVTRLPTIVDAVKAPYLDLLAEDTGRRVLSKRFVDNKEVTDHHAIIPTGKTLPAEAFSREEANVFDLVVRRLLAAWQRDEIQLTGKIQLQANVSAVKTHLFYLSRTITLDAGWKVLEAKKIALENRPALKIKKGESIPVREFKPEDKATKPPPRLNEASLLTAMESAGKSLNDKELSDAMKDRGLGTPATRASIIEILLHRGFIMRDGRSLQATDKAFKLIGLVHSEVKSPEMTGRWEAQLRSIEKGTVSFSAFMTDIEDYLRRVIGEAAPPSRGSSPPRPSTAPVPSRPAVVKPVTHVVAREPGPPVLRPAGKDLQTWLRDVFKLSQFRQFQEEICQTVTAGHDTLVVMPTGSGKSLCYQLPALVRGGSALVISPLLALIEDQVQKLQALGLKAERIHSGRARHDSRLALSRYLGGDLDFLFIAPERLSVPGFAEALKQRPPALLAIDEAHCISHWGHDFRPDYRLLGERLCFDQRPPIVALTATATPLVQDDIVQQLGLKEAKRYVHAFRRDNIAIEVVRGNMEERTDYAFKLLKKEERRPAIVYVPSRRQAEAIAKKWSKKLTVAVYHAGLDADVRAQAQEKFMNGHADVIVATVAFGMGIDKWNVRTVIHLFMPQSLENYYQEIGRAGRDAKLSRAVLFWSPGDRKLQQFLFEKDYPPIEQIDAVYKKLGRNTLQIEEVAKMKGMDVATAAKVVEKLRQLGGATINEYGELVLGADTWRAKYLEQSRHRLQQMETMFDFARQGDCRMRQICHYFGEDVSTMGPCGICDVCAPKSCDAKTVRLIQPEELKCALKVLGTLTKKGPLSLGKLFQDVGEKAGLNKTLFESILVGMEDASLLRLSEDYFDKSGTRIYYTRVLPSGGSANVDKTEVQNIIVNEV